MRCVESLESVKCHKFNPHKPIFCRHSLPSIQGQKNRKYRWKNRRKIVFRWSSKRKTLRKFDCQKNRQKIGFIGDFSPKNRRRTKNRWKDRPWSTRAGRRVCYWRSRRKIGEISNLSAINRRYIGRFVGRIQAAQIRSLLCSNGADLFRVFFKIQRLYL